jgi:eukaryotic-like serine/threonine-protein kinase
MATGRPPPEDSDDARADPFDADASIATVTMAPLPAEAVDEPPTSPIHERYQVTGVIGRGGMATVYRGHDVRLGRDVALKLVTSSPAHRNRLLREAQALAQLAHPHVVPVYDVGTVGDAVFMAMELVEGVDLRQWLDREPRTPRAIVAVFAAAGEGLAAAHAAGLVHRDFKPANVIVGADGRVRVVDFGLARTAGDSDPTSSPAMRPPPAARTAAVGARGADPSEPVASSHVSPHLESSLTRHGDVVGTPRYMSPEQRRAEATDARTDQFSFCLALYEALYGEMPFPSRQARRAFFDGTGPALEPPARPGIPGHVRRVLRRGLSRDPAARFPSMTAVVAELRRDVRGRRIAIAAGVAVVASIGVAVGSLARSAPEPCRGASERAAAALPADLRERTLDALRATAAPLAPRAASRLDEQLGRYVGEWSALRTGTCRATRVHGEQPQEVMDRTLRCLDDNIAGVAAFLRALAAAASEDSLTRADVELERLSSLALCRDAEALARRDQMPVAAHEQVVAARLEVAIRDLSAANAVDDTRAGARLAPTVLALAAAVSHADTRARAFYAYADAHRRAGNLAENARALDETLRLATESRNHRLIAQAWSDLLWQAAIDERRPEASRELVRVTELALLAARDEPDFPRLEADVRHVLATVMTHSNQLARAEKEFRQVLALPQPPLMRGASLNNLAIVLIYRDRLDEARAALRESEAIDTAIYGELRPYGSANALNVGLTHHWQGDLATAERHYREAIALSVARAGSTVSTLLYRLYLGHLLVDRGAWAEAGRELDTALAGLTEALGADAELTRHVRVQRARLALGRGDARTARAEIEAVKAAVVTSKSLDDISAGHPDPLAVEGRVLLAEGKPALAARALEASLERHRRLYGEGGLALAEPMLALAEVAIGTGRPGDAAAIADQVLALLGATASVPQDPRRAAALFARARARSALGTHADAGADARQALAIWQEAAPDHPQVATVRDFVTRHAETR